MCTELSTPLTGLVMYYKFNHGTAGGNNAGQKKLLNSAYPNLFTASLKNFTLDGGTSNWVTGATCIVAQPSISSPVLSKTSFCAGTTFSLTFTSSGNFGGGNTFQAILSDKNGAFTTGQVIGKASTSGTIQCTISSNIAFGENYQIKVTSTSPVINGATNVGILTVHAKDRTLVSPSNDSSSGNLTIKATDTITATNANTGSVNASFQAGKSVLLLLGSR